jgi:hypothetical protein
MIPEDNEDKLLRSVALQNAESIRIARQRAEEQTDAALWEQAFLLNLTRGMRFAPHQDRRFAAIDAIETKRNKRKAAI